MRINVSLDKLVLPEMSAAFTARLYQRLCAHVSHSEAAEIINSLRLQSDEQKGAIILFDVGSSLSSTATIVEILNDTLSEHTWGAKFNVSVPPDVVLELTAPGSVKPDERFTPPRLGERTLLLVLRTKEERANIPGDLEEEFKQIAAKHGARYAKLWYYKQVVASAWPLLRKAVGWGLLASLGAWIRRYI